MKMFIKVAAVILLLVITLISINAADGGTKKIVLDGAGNPHAAYDTQTKKISYWCDGTNSNPCKITVEFQQ